MTELTCQKCRELAAELALDVLVGVERARALVHLDGCTTCRDTVSTLAATADRLLKLLPDAEPPAGFEQRVITALGSASRHVPNSHPTLIQARPLTSQAGVSHGPGSLPFLPGPGPAPGPRQSDPIHPGGDADQPGRCVDQTRFFDSPAARQQRGKGPLQPRGKATEDYISGRGGVLISSTERGEPANTSGASRYLSVDPQTLGLLRTLKIGDVELQLDSHRLLVRGTPVHLSRKELVILQQLMDNAGRVLTRPELIDNAWGPDQANVRGYLEVHIRRLRRKIESDPDRPTRIRTVRGVGYIFDLPQDNQRH
ncbi:MAG TPA: winged helix-turn-helix domain-containing protein [Pseudonocardiaceae bacterium]|nr:winged helix-turn-helix domain-containing protein [Pseudonocardiaceae bacterium]